MSVEERRKLARLNNNRYLGFPHYYYTKRGVLVLLGSAAITYFVGQFIEDKVFWGGVFIALAYILMIAFPVDYVEKERPFYLLLLRKLKSVLVFVVVVLLSGCAIYQKEVKKEVKTYMDILEKAERKYRDPAFEREILELIKNTHKR